MKPEKEVEEPWEEVLSRTEVLRVAEKIYPVLVAESDWQEREEDVATRAIHKAKLLLIASRMESSGEATPARGFWDKYGRWYLVED